MFAMDKAQRIQALHKRKAEFESELSATVRDLPEDSTLAPEEVERFRKLDIGYREVLEELEKLESEDHNSATHF